MTDENLVNLDANQQPAEVDNSVPQVEGQSFEQQPQEKLLTQSQVNSIVKAQTSKAYQKGLESATQQSTANHEHRPQPSQIDIDKIVSEKVQDSIEKYEKNQRDAAIVQQQQALLNRVNSDINKKLETVKGESEDAKKALDAVDNFNSYNFTRYYASKFDNGGEILSYLANNLDKAANLEMLGRNVPDELVLDQAFKKISDSISKNKQAKNAPKAPTPIRQIESDRQDGYGGNGEMSVRDWQKILTV